MRAGYGWQANLRAYVANAGAATTPVLIGPSAGSGSPATPS